MRDLISPGFWAWAHAGDELSIDTLPSGKFPHLYALLVCGRIKTVGDIHNLPRSFTRGDGQRYEEEQVFAGREFPRGWDRGLWGEGAPAEPPPEPDGKVDTFRMERNALRRELDEEIGAYYEYRDRGKIK